VFKKAFDAINHNRLLKKLENTGLGNRTIKLIRNYLANRKQKTTLNGYTSTLKTIKTGVPQGSTLGPLLFLIYINDISEAIPNLSKLLFADDTVIYTTGNDPKKLQLKMQTELDNVMRWCDKNELTLNTSKTKYMIFSNKTKEHKFNNIDICMKGEKLENVDTYKYLGTTLDKRLNGQAQLNKITSLMEMHLNTFRKIRNLLNTETAIQIYKTTILPILDYNDIYYNLLTVQNQNKLQTLQNRALRTVFNHEIWKTDKLHTEAKMQKLNIRRDHHILRIMHDRSQHKKYKANPNEMNVRTRAHDGPILKLKKTKTTKAQHAPSYWGSTLYNSLPSAIRRIKNKKLFQLSIKKHLNR